VATHAVHLADGAGEQAAEGAGQGGGAEEEAEALLGLAPLVPHAHEVEAWAVSIYKKKNWLREQHTPRKHAGLEHAQEEAGGHEPAPVLDQALADHDETKHEHAERHWQRYVSTNASLIREREGGSEGERERENSRQT